MRAWQLLCPLVLAGLAAVVSAADAPCAPTLSFFPQGSEDKNWPPAWGKSNQRRAGNTADDALLPIALSPILNISAIPTLQVVVSHPLLTVGQTVNTAACVGAATTTANVSRRLMAIAPSGTVTTPGKYQITYSVNGSAPVAFGPFDGAATTVPQITFRGLQNLTDGYYCAQLTAQVMANTARISTGGGFQAVPSSNIAVIRHICFYKVDKRPTANVTVQSCGAQATVQVDDMSPGPILLPDTTQFLLRPVYHIWTSYNSTKDGSSNYPGPDVMTSLNFWFAQNNSVDLTVLTPDTALPEGWYNLQMETSFTSDVPALVGLAGTEVSTYGGEPGVPDDLSSQQKFGAADAIEEKLVGVQTTNTTFQYLNGPSSSLLQGDTADFTWGFTGFGKTFCYKDGAPYIPIGKKNNACVAPLQVPINDKLNHTIDIVLQDVCGQSVNASAAYGLWGYKVLTKTANTDTGSGSGSNTPLPPVSGTPTVRRNAGSAPSSSTWAVTLAAVGAAVAALVL